MPPSPFARIVPAIRTVPGVEVFDYRIPEGLDIQIGDVIRVPFRRRQLPSMVIGFVETSPFAAKTVPIPVESPLLRLGPIPAKLLEMTAAHTLTSQPSVLLSWLREVPKRVAGLEVSDGMKIKTDADGTEPRATTGFSIHVLSDRLRGSDGLFEIARQSKGRVLILTPWKERADRIAKELDGSAYHADLTPTAAWKILQRFCSSKQEILVTTRVGAWLTSIADVILVDEPENDDHKQDELSPRFDSRWMAALAQSLRPEIQVHAFSTTPRLLRLDPGEVPMIELLPTLDPWVRGKRSRVQILSEGSDLSLQTAIDEERPAIIIHNVEGSRARICCRDCGWTATCPSCGFVLSLGPTGAVCRKCSKKTNTPEGCGKCGGYDLTRGRLGREAVTEQCNQFFAPGKVQVVSSLEFDACDLTNAEVVISDISSIAGGAEDIRRKERLAIHLRRIAAACAVAQAHLTIHGQTETVEEAVSWLMPESLTKLWQQEYRDRGLFGYPPAKRLVKVLIDGTEDEVRHLQELLKQHLGTAWQIRGPFAIAYRSTTRSSRSVLHLLPPVGTPEAAVLAELAPFKGQALFDLDPIAFFC